MKTILLISVLFSASASAQRISPAQKELIENNVRDKIKMQEAEDAAAEKDSAEIKELRFLMDQHFTSGTIYFGGTGFPNISMANLKGVPKNTVKSLLIKSGPGTVIDFENGVYTDANNKKVIVSKKFILP